MMRDMNEMIGTMLPCAFFLRQGKLPSTPLTEPRCYSGDNVLSLFKFTAEALMSWNGDWAKDLLIFAAGQGRA